MWSLFRTPQRVGEQRGFQSLPLHFHYSENEKEKEKGKNV